MLRTDDVVYEWSLAGVGAALGVVGAALVVGGEEVVVDAALAALGLDPTHDHVAGDPEGTLRGPSFEISQSSKLKLCPS